MPLIRPRLANALVLVLFMLVAPSVIAAPNPQRAPDQVLIKFRPAARAADRAAIRASMNAKPLRNFAFIGVEQLAIRGMTPEQAVARFKNHPHVEYIEPNFQVSVVNTPDDPRFPEMWALRNIGQTGGAPGADIKATQAWDIFTGDPKLIVGVIDTGIDYTHPDLAANVWTNPDEIPGNGIDDDGNGYVDDVHGYDFEGNDGDPMDDNGHGTHVAGTIAALGNNGIGVAGINWRAKVVGIKFLNSFGSGWVDDAIAGLQYSIAIGARLTSNSWGAGGSSRALLDAIEAAGAAGQLFVAAAGNAGTDNDVSPFYPCSYDSPYIISVAATDAGDRLASFSNYGATSVDVAAPGVRILSTWPEASYAILSGTSMAAPHVAGAVALCWGRYPQLTNLQVKNRILTTVDPVPALSGRCLTGGRIDLLRAISGDDHVPPSDIADLRTGEPGSNTIRLSWTAPGDDGVGGQAASYEVRYATSPITEANLESAAIAPSQSPRPSGSLESLEVGGLGFGTTYYFGIKAFDEFGNGSALSNVTQGTTLGIPVISVSPTSVSAEVVTGGTQTRSVLVANTGEGTLDFTVSLAEPLAASDLAKNEPPLAKGEEGPVGPAQTLNHGGPDGFGYRWTDSDEAGGPAFEWVDPVGAVAPVPLIGDDAISEPISMGMDFPFYGAVVRSVRICTNGWLSFTDSSTVYDNKTLPSFEAPSNLIAPFWDDLDFGTTARVLAWNDGSRFIVMWVDVPRYAFGGPVTFQAILAPNGEIKFQYLLSADAISYSATVGIQGASHYNGLTIVKDVEYLRSGLAVRIIPTPRWLSMTPSSGRVSSGESRTVDIRFDGTDLPAGDRSAAFRIESNDPDRHTVSVAANIRVIGAPNIVVSPTEVEFGETAVGTSPTRTIQVSNTGTDVLRVQNIASDDPAITVSPAAFALDPLGTQVVTVAYTPSAAPVFTLATLSIASDDPDQPTVSVSVIGLGVPPPVIQVAPAAFDVSLAIGEAATRSVTISNTGEGTYEFTAEAVPVPPAGGVSAQSDPGKVVVGKGEPDVAFGPAPLRVGGPDLFGYRYRDSDEPGGPAFSWVEISGVGSQIDLVGDEANSGPYSIGFEAPFYGHRFDSFRICTNGWVSFTSGSTLQSNTALPNDAADVPENLLAVLWDDLIFGDAKRAFYYNDGTRLIIEYVDVPQYFDREPNTFEIILYPTGRIVFQYLEIAPRVEKTCTVGIQNGLRNDGLQIAFNSAYVRAGLAVEFQPPERPYISVAPAFGAVPPGGSLNLSVGFDATNLFGGEYDAVVRIHGNSPIAPVRDIPSRLIVGGVPDLAGVPEHVDFDSVFVGFPSTRPVAVQNRGSATLNILDIRVSDPAYGVDRTSFRIAPWGTETFSVMFDPDAPGSAVATLTIESNDADRPTTVVALLGVALDPPIGQFQPGSVDAAVAIPSSTSRSIVLHNAGGSDLAFAVTSDLPASAAVIQDERFPTSGTGQASTGTTGGGPDEFGYRWRDSDDPSGPTFDWVDIKKVENQVPVLLDDLTLVSWTPIGFQFPFYGERFDSINVCTNGWVSFTSQSRSPDDQPLPNSSPGVPENLLAPFWDDLDLGTVYRIYAGGDSTRFVVSYIDVPRAAGSDTCTFQVVLYPSGRIVYQYLEMRGSGFDQGTIGIQNATRTDGLTVVHDAPYVHDRLAVEFRSIPEWLRVAPAAGVVPPGGSVGIDLELDARDLFAGTYEGDVRIATNDPSRPSIVIPVAMTASGTPEATSNPSHLDFGSVYVNQARDLAVEIRNGGSDALTIRSAATTHSAFHLVEVPMPFVLGRHGTASLTVRFEPTQVCGASAPCAGELVIESDDPLHGSVAIPLTGLALIPPEAEVSPASLHTALATTLGPKALTRTKSLRLDNPGGSDLVWTAEALSLLPAGIDMTRSAETGKDQVGEPGGIAPLAFGGPDASGYRYADSDDPVQGTPFEWFEIAAVGTRIAFDGDDQNLGPFPLPFSFPFYGGTFREFRACTNGWISFTSPSATFTNTGLPNGTAPENLVAPFWDDLDFRATGKAYYHYDGSRFVIEYVSVPHYTSGGPYTFEIILYPSGAIDFQYLDMQGTRLNEGAIGIQNASKDVGLQAANNSPYARNGLRVRFVRRSGWLTVSPAGGTLPAGGQVDLDLGFDATDLADGDYTGVVRVASNDPADPRREVQCDLHVGTVPIEFDLVTKVLNRGSNGNWVTGRVEPTIDLDPRSIRVSSVLLQRTIPVASGAPATYGDEDRDGLAEATYNFDRTALQAILPVGSAVPVEVMGEFEDATWFSGTDVVRMLKPRVKAAGGLAETGKESRGPAYRAGAAIRLVWEDPEEFQGGYYELWFTSDGGTSWALVSGHMMERSFQWSVPAIPTSAGRLELVAIDAQGFQGSWISEEFAIATSPEDLADQAVIPREFGIAARGPNPSPGSGVRFELAIPTPSLVIVRVFDVRGGLVRELLQRTLGPGRHGVQWDGKSASGQPVGSGIYYIQALVGEKNLVMRHAIVR